MTTVTKTPMAPRTSKKKKLATTRARRNTKAAAAPLQGAAAVAQVLDAFSLLPFHCIAEGRGQSMRSLFKELTGQNLTRLTKAKVRESTLKAIETRQQRWLEEQFKDFPEGLIRFREHMASAPHTAAGAQASWAVWIHQFEQPPGLNLPISKAVGLVIDELIERLKHHCQTDDLPAYRQTWLDHFAHHGELIRIGDEPAAMPVAPTDPDMDSLRGMNTWEIANQLTRKLLDGLYIDLISSLDAEWGGWYFDGAEPLQLFPLVMVRVQEGLLDGKKPKSRKNLVHRPSKRLLEFLHAIMVHRFSGQWNERPASPKELAGALNLMPSDISNHYDGTRRLTFKNVENFWRQLIKSCSKGHTKPAEMPAPPMPMVTLALHWQTLLVLDKGKSFFLFDLESYNNCWQLRHQQWAALESERAKGDLPVGHPTKESVVWPAWMLNQSSLLS